MPGSFAINSPGGVPNTVGLPTVQGFASGETTPFEYPSAIAGVTRDGNGNALAHCALILFRTIDNSIAALGQSDGSGQYRLGASMALSHYLVAYLAGSPDVCGTSVNTLVGA